jgi:hypothetical protein
LVGLGLLSVGIWLWHCNRSFANRAITATGTVVRLEIKQSTDTDGLVVDYVRPVVSFQANGKNVEFVSVVGSRPAQYEIGDKVRVIFPADDPHAARINGWVEQCGEPFGFVFLAALALGSSIYILMTR